LTSSTSRSTATAALAGQTLVLLLLQLLLEQLLHQLIVT
jgi:hypothetical protein